MLARMGDPCVMIAPPLPYLWDAAQAMGLARQTSMGVEAWDWANVNAAVFAVLPGAEPWEAQALRQMSQAYVRALMTSTEPLSMSPAQIALGDAFKDLIPADAKPGEVVTISLPEE